jgi:hypothetical protein
LRRAECGAQGRHVEVIDDRDGSGMSWIEGKLFSHDAAALDERLDEMARAVCAADPRTLEQRRADALGALAQGGDRLTCGCSDPVCAAARAPAPSSVVVNVIAEQASLSEDIAVALDGAPAPGPPTAPLRELTIAQALAPPPGIGPAVSKPALVMGGAILPAPLLAAKLAHTATIRPVIHPGDRAPEPRYAPSAGLARFVRCRDLTCRFPGCDAPADHCDIDHTIAYPVGPTQAANLKCLCRKHHLLKTFWGWLDRQRPDGTVIWTSPGGQTYTTHPGSRLLFPTLCRPTAPLNTRVNVPSAESNRALMMPRRTNTRTQNRAKRIETERKLNDAYVTERNRPPPF